MQLFPTALRCTAFPSPGKRKQRIFRAHASDMIASGQEALRRVLFASLHHRFLPADQNPGCFSSAIFTPTLFDDDKSRCVLSDWPTFRCHSPSYCIIMFIFGSCAPATCPCVLVSFLRFCSERVARANRRSSAPPMQPANPPPPGKCNPA